MRRISSCALSAFNITAAASTQSYTAACDVDLLVTISGSGLTGGSVYSAWITRQIAGAGAAYPSASTTDGVASGCVNHMFPSILIPLTTNDVLKTWLIGSASDTSVAVTTELWEMNYARPITNTQYFVNVNSSGQLTIAPSAIGASQFAASAVDGAAVSQSAGSRVWDAGVRTLTGLGASTITACTFGASALDSVALSVTAASKISNQVWSDSPSSYGAGTAGSTLATAGSATSLTAATIWTYGTRTLTQPGATLASIVSGSAITLQRGDDNSFAITGLGSLTARSKLWFTAKRTDGDADASAFVQIEESASLIYLNGAAGTAACGGLTVNSAASGNITVRVGNGAAAQLARGYGGYYDIQMRDTSGCVLTLSSGEFNVAGDITRATS